jgi:hypothetical protein
LRRPDSDYDDWRRERFQRFSEEFEQWRNSRGQARAQGGGAVGSGTPADAAAGGGAASQESDTTAEGASSTTSSSKSRS